MCVCINTHMDYQQEIRCKT